MKKRCFLLLLWPLFLLPKKGWAEQSSGAFQQDTARISACIAQARKYSNKNQFDSALYFVQQGFQLSKKWNITTYYSPLYRCWGSYYLRTNKSDKVLVMYKRARLWARRHGNKNEIAVIGYSLAIAYNLKFAQTKSKVYQKAMIRQLYENLRFAALYGTTYYIKGTYSLLAALGNQYGNDSLRYHYFAKLLPLIEPKTSTTGSIEYMYFSFSLSLHQNDRKSAQQYYQALLNIKNKQDFMSYYTDAIISILSDCIKFESWDLAAQVADDIQQRHLTYMNKPNRYIFYKNLASIYIHTKKYSQATQAVQKAHKCATEIADIRAVAPVDRLQLLENEQKIAEYNKQYPQALALYKRVVSWKDSIRADYGSFDLILIEERLASEQKERELQLKRLENQREAERNRQKTWIGAVVIVLLSGVVILISLQTRKINQQRQRLEVMNQTKDRLFAIIGHDLRTPIVSTKINLSRLARQKQISVTDFRTAVHKQVPRLQTLLLTVDNLLYWSHNQQNTFQLQAKHVLLNDVLQEVLEMLEESLELNKIILQNELTDELTLIFDSNHLRIILQNVIQNAIKFTPQGGQISFTAEVMLNQVTLAVKDTGMGFGQSQKDTSKQGTGLGLKLVKQLMELNNGTLEIAPVQGEGAEVRLRFPKV